jgi:hypothetical protein
MTLRSKAALVAAVAAGVGAFLALRFSGFYNAPMNPGHGDAGELIDFECGTPAQPGIAVHLVSMKETTSARCSCAALEGAMRALEQCCNNQSASAEAACEDRTTFDVNCAGSDAGGLAFSGPGNPTLRITFFGGFSRSNWSCALEGAPNPDLEQIQKVFQSCCAK